MDVSVEAVLFKNVNKQLMVQGFLVEHLNECLFQIILDPFVELPMQLRGSKTPHSLEDLWHPWAIKTL
jgi:hypothetical protein